MQFYHHRVKTRNRVESSQKQWGGITRAGRVMQKKWDLYTAPPGAKKSCKVLTHGTGRAAEGVETTEMESFQRKLVFYYLCDWTGRRKTLTQTMTSSKDFQKEFAGEETMLEQKQHFSITVETARTSWKSSNQDFIFVLRIFLAFSLVFPRAFLQCDICGRPDHQSVTS